jgi:quinol monooxygenase YgiN
MNTTKEPLHENLTQPSLLADEISITGKWVPTRKGGIFRKSAESKEMLKEWEDIHEEARSHEGMLSTEINHAVGQDAVLVHHVFQNSDALVKYFTTTASAHMRALTEVAKPEIHLIRGKAISQEAREAIMAKRVPGNFGEFLFGYVKNDYQRPDPENAIQVTAKWTCKPGDSSQIDELIYWWQQVGTEAFTLEKGLVRFEVFRVIGEDALIIHETFDTSDELKFHLSKGTAEKYKKDIDKIAVPECYFFRGPVSWTIRTYSKFLRLPATYSSQGSHYMKGNGNMSDGTL